MKKVIVFGFPILIVMLTSCGKSSEAEKARFDSIQAAFTNPWNKEQAELITGNTVRFSEGSAGSSPNHYWHIAKFISDSVNSLGQLSMLEFTFQEYIEIDSTKRSYVLNKELYRKDGRLEEVPGLGDEAFFLTDDTRFYFFLVRKGSKELRIRLDFISDITTKENFLRVAREVTETM